MEYEGSIKEINDRLMSLIYDDALLIKIALSVICLISLFFLTISLYRWLKRRWESFYYVLLCSSVIIFATLSLIASFSRSQQLEEALNALRMIGVIPIPAMLCLHVRQQVSYKVQNPVTVFLLFATPAFVGLMIFRDVFFPQLLAVLPAVNDAQWVILIFYFYVIAALIRSYLLCFNVLYQMPQRTRKSTQYMLVGVSSAALLFSINALWVGQLSVLIPQSATLDLFVPLGAPLSFFFLLYPLYGALRVMPAADVIVTSREFVMGGLDTTILVLNSKKRILDWNRKDWEDEFPLPRPLYEEPIEKYRERILKTRSSRVSSHSEDIIIITKDDKEMYFSVRVHEVGNNRRSFGYIVEIPEVTSIYAIVRYFEEIAHYDALTGLHNRNAYFDRVKTITKEEHMPLLIFVGDVNYLKKINDNYGHLFGDELLKTVAMVIKKAMPKNAFVARTGGDEFVLLIPGGDDAIADKFVHDLIDLCQEINHEVFGSPSISWGYSIMTSADQSYNEVFERADALMYEYKKSRHIFRSSSLLPNEEQR